MFTEKSASALLDFLRNLTPQILLLSVALVLGSRLDTSRFVFTLQGLGNAWPFASLVIVFMVAFLANLLLLLERILETSEKASIELARAARLELGVLRKLLALCSVLWRHDKPFLLRIGVALLLVMSGTVALLMSATVGAVQVLRAIGAA